MTNATAQKAQLRAIVAAWSRRLGVQPRGVYVQKMNAKWASCSANGRLCFSVALLRQSAAFQEVVIVHELLHLRVPNHGRLFQALLSAHLPAWRRTLEKRATAAYNANVCGGQAGELD